MPKPTIRMTSAALMLLALAACGGTDDTPAPEAATPAPAAEATAATAPDVAPAPQAACNRDCLLDRTKSYIAALVAHDPSQAPLADDIVFVENVTRMQPGEGLWQSIVSAPGSFELYVPDEINQSAGWLGMMTYRAAPVAPQGMSPEERLEWSLAQV
ncbi:MAG TPA: hypothetical protein VGE69_05170, partial [Pseudomonadales bacterium]